jgi:hypothetical protein
MTELIMQNVMNNLTIVVIVNALSTFALFVWVATSNDKGNTK